LQGVRIPFAILEIVSRHILFFFVFNAVWALMSGGFRMVSDRLVSIPLKLSVSRTISEIFSVKE